MMREASDVRSYPAEFRRKVLIAGCPVRKVTAALHLSGQTIYVLLVKTALTLTCSLGLTSADHVSRSLRGTGSYSWSPSTPAWSRLLPGCVSVLEDMAFAGANTLPLRIIDLDARDAEALSADMLASWTGVMRSLTAGWLRTPP